MIKTCNCKEYFGNNEGAKYQDKKYGKNQRVHTIHSKSTPVQYSCTVCGRQSGGIKK